jgi:hypothetical protein
MLKYLIARFQHFLELLSVVENVPGEFISDSKLRLVLSFNVPWECVGAVLRDIGDGWQFAQAGDVTDHFAPNWRAPVWIFAWMVH